MTIKFGSVCSGIEAASVAWGGLGWSAAWFSEIEKFPCAVLAHHYPHVPNYGDMTALPERILSAEVEAPDVFCGGTPCQAFSVAGKRQSLNDVRGNLSLTFCETANAIDIIRRQRNEPESIIFWENVPGVLNTPDNAFGCFLAGLAGEDDPLQPAGKRWTNAGAVLGPKRAVAWRVLDAQYFGLAQRRKRVFVIASARDGFDPAAVLFEFEGLRRDTPPSRETREEIASGTGAGTTFSCAGIEVYASSNIAATLLKTDQDLSNGCEALITLFENHPTDSRIKQVSISPTVISRWGTGGGNLPIALAENTGVHGVAHSMQVRKLTPIECERLQGFPDDYTRIPWKNKPASECPDSHRYKALGNSWAVPVVTWIGERINKEFKK